MSSLKKHNYNYFQIHTNNTVIYTHTTVDFQMMASCGTVNQVCRKLYRLSKTVSNQKKNFIGN